MKIPAVCLTTAMLACSGRLYGEEAATALTKAEIESIVREYIMQHPEVLMESVRAYQERERLQAQRRSREAVAANKHELFNDAASPVAGDAEAEVAIVQFFDYKCGYCRRVAPAVFQLLEAHEDVRVVFKELPILGPESQMAARAALAAGRQGFYLAFHRELMSLNGSITLGVIEDTGKKLGLDLEKLKSDMSSKEIEAMLLENQRLASAIGVQATPSFVIGDEVISGAMDLTRFDQLISKSKKR